MRVADFSDVADLISGVTFKKADSKNEKLPGTIGVLRAGNIQDSEVEMGDVVYVPEKLVKPLQQLKKGDVLIASSSGSLNIVGKAAAVLSDVNVAFGAFCKVARPKKDVIHAAYFKHFFRSTGYRREVRERAEGANINNLNKGDFLSLQIPLPPLEEQKRIAGILDEADRVRKKTQALIDKYDELAQSLFLDMFGDPVTNPKGWEVKCLKELAEKITSGSTPKGGSDVYVDAGIPFFRCQNIWRGYFKEDELARIHLNIHNKNRNSQLRFGDILITKTGRKNTENSSLGRAAMFRGEEGNISTDVIMIRLTEEVDSEFVEFILASNLYRDYIRGKSVGGTDKRHLYVEHVGSFKIILPPREKRSEFINRLTSMRLQLQNLEMMFNCANDAFNALLQKAFKGELN